ncbi:LacI family DNA-binding transcriptional regulator [Rubrivirga sp.]|uniref:LacI family DNA-binding transcriptional regulator n=1 Tax=Rubrivirga sp. TaxID=1885344 RepID=UPI003B523CF4
MATLKDVAARANVSFSTVSRAINEPGRVNADTRARVEEAIRHLRYTPHRAARRLRGRSTHAQIFGLLIPDIENPFYSGIVRGVEDRAYAEGYAVILSNTNEDLDRERFYLDVLRQEAAAGAILPPLSDGSPVPYHPDALGFPVVCFDRRPEIDGLDTVVVDNEQGAFDAVSHLIGLGHRRIGLVVASLDLSTSRERADGYRRALREHDVPVAEELVRTGEPRKEAGQTLSLDLLQSADRPTALFAGNNVMAMGALTAAQALGLRIPDDLSVVGFDDPPWVELVTTPLTTVRQPAYEIGRTAADLLLQRVADPDRASSVVVLPTTLVVRASCAAPGA